MRERGIAPEHVKAFVITHGHRDHAAGAKYFQDKYGTPIIAGKGDAEILARGKSDPHPERRPGFETRFRNDLR